MSTHYKQEGLPIALCGLSGLSLQFSKDIEKVDCGKCKRSLNKPVTNEISSRLKFLSKKRK